MRKLCNWCLYTNSSADTRFWKSIVFRNVTKNVLVLISFFSRFPARLTNCCLFVCINGRSCAARHTPLSNNVRYELFLG